MQKNKYVKERLDKETLLCIYPNIEIADEDFEERTEKGQRIKSCYEFDGLEHIEWECGIRS